MIFFFDLAAVALAVYGPPNPLGNYWRALAVARDAWLEAGGCTVCGGLGLVAGLLCSKLKENVRNASGKPMLTSEELARALNASLLAPRPLLPGHGPLDPFLLLVDITRKQKPKPPQHRSTQFHSPYVEIPPHEVGTVEILPTQPFRPLKFVYLTSRLVPPDPAEKMVVVDLQINLRTQFRDGLAFYCPLATFDVRSIHEQQRWDACMPGQSILFFIRNENDFPVAVSMSAHGRVIDHSEDSMWTGSLAGHVVE